MESQVNAQYICGIYQNKDKLTVLVDLEMILDINEIKKSQNKAA